MPTLAWAYENVIAQNMLAQEQAWHPKIILAKPKTQRLIQQKSPSTPSQRLMSFDQDA